MFNTDHYSSRYFNDVIAVDNIVIKSSDDLEKIKSEYDYYYYLPDSIKRYFVQPFSFQYVDGLASYKMERIDTQNAGEIMVNGEMSLASFKRMISRVEDFKSELKPLDYDYESSYLESKYLVLDKTFNRIKTFKLYDESMELFERVCNAYEHFVKDRSVWDRKLSHGDLCLSNILWIDEINLIKFIDPRGAKKEEDIYMDEYYDMAKLAHSVINGYDNVLLRKNFYSKEMSDVLIKFFKKNEISIDLLSVYQASLFLSMAPLHVDSGNRVALFMNKCDKILSSIGY
jgi:hypothetical protein